MAGKILDNGALITLGLVGVVAAVGAANKAGLYGSRAQESHSVFNSPHWRYLNRHIAEVSEADPHVVRITGNPAIYSRGRGGGSEGKMPGSKKTGVYEDGWYFTTYINLDDRGAGPFDSEEEAIEAHEAQDREDPEWASDE
jgi:hypothetical protein